jgi:murein DD-endopeptidase MepM/ murein hydrolase activator NlpD
MSRYGTRRLVALVVSGGLLVGALVAVASATSSLDGALRVRRDLRKQIEQIHKHRLSQRLAIHKQIHVLQGRGQSKVGLDGVANARTRYGHRRQVRQLKALKHQEEAVVAAAKTKVSALRSRRTDLLGWIDTYAIFRYCPVDGPHEVADNFGVMVRIQGVPPHIHQGNDISAPEGTPIVAPFDGTAVAGHNDLGGNSVDVYGDLGHVYNAHLSSYGKLGPVSAGDIIGYVGTTGDATGPHDHFEWHPGDGDAVDPNPFLAVVC